MAVMIKNAQEIEHMRKAGRLVAEVLARLEERVAPGVTTGELDRLATDVIARAGAKAAFKGYANPEGGKRFPAVVCTSVNDQVVHGIPSETVRLEEGDVVSVDCGVALGGFYGDAARTFAVGKVTGEAENLLAVTKQALQLAIETCSVGARLTDLGRRVQQYVEAQGMSVVRDFVGHGVGRSLHEDPEIPNYWNGSRRGGRFRAGMVVALEPMVNLGTHRTHVTEDGWTVVTQDGSLSAHFEDTVAVTDDGPLILTA
jgi:methionyl aminopeptidase